MKKTLLQEVKEMNRIAGTQMTREQEIKLIKERLEELKPIDEAFEIPMLIALLGAIPTTGAALLPIFARDSDGANVGGVEYLIDKAKNTYRIWKQGKKLNPTAVKDIVNDFNKKINQLSPGKKRFMKTVISKLEKADPNDKRELVRAHDELKRYANQYDLKENKKK